MNTKRVIDSLRQNSAKQLVLILALNLLTGNQYAFSYSFPNRLSGKNLSTPKTKLFGTASTAAPANPKLPVGELEELNAYAKQFRNRLDPTKEKTNKHWNGVLFRHKLWLYTIDKDKFLGNCSVAKLGDDGDTDKCKPIAAKFAYYLVLVHFNIPAVKATALPFKYGFARFEAKLACQGNRDISEDQHPDLFALKLSESAEVLSVYPENAVLPVDRKDTTTVTLTAQPEWAGASGGSAEYSRAIEDSYVYKLPHVVGVSSRFGDVSWTFYPAKAQPIMLGTQSTFAVIKVPVTAKSLRILANLRYQLQTLEYLTFWPFRVCDFTDLDLEGASSFDDLASIQYFGLPEGARESLQTAFGKGNPVHSFKCVSNKKTGRELLVDEKTGQVFGFKEDNGVLQRYEIKDLPEECTTSK